VVEVSFQVKRSCIVSCRDAQLATRLHLASLAVFVVGPATPGKAFRQTFNAI